MRRSAMLLALALLGACDANTGPGGSGTFTITPHMAVIQPGDTVVLAATTTEVLVTPVIWKSLNTGIATVDSLGRAIGVAVGVDSIQIAASTEDADLADTSVVAVAAGCPGSPFITAVNLAGTSTPAHLESIAVPVDVRSGGLCPNSTTVQRLLLTIQSATGAEQVVASDTIPTPIPDRWRSTMTFDPAMTLPGGGKILPGDYTLSVVWTGSTGGTAAAALPITIRTP